MSSTLLATSRLISTLVLFSCFTIMPVSADNEISASGQDSTYIKTSTDSPPGQTSSSWQNDIVACNKIISTSKQKFTTPVYTSVSAALADYQTGDVLCLDDGEQKPIVIDKFKAGSQALTIRPLHFRASKITHSNYRGVGVVISNSQGIIVRDLIINGGLNAINIYDSSNISLIANVIFNIGNQAVSIKPKVYGGSDYLIKNNIIFNTGLRQAQYGEGIYLGNGTYKKDKSGLAVSQTVHNIDVIGNYIYNTNNEAIDVKSNAYNVNIVGNYISDVNLKFNAAITIGTEASFASNGGYLVEKNTITNVHNRSGWRPIGIAVGHGDTIVKDNLIIDNKKITLAICMYSTFLNPKLNKVRVQNNQLIGQGSLLDANCTGGTTANAHAKIAKE